MHNYLPTNVEGNENSESEMKQVRALTGSRNVKRTMVNRGALVQMTKGGGQEGGAMTEVMRRNYAT